jgi:hypothetical protein
MCDFIFDYAGFRAYSASVGAVAGKAGLKIC